jgi:HAD superfamily hydrolase (TIGR01509 family)
MTAGGERRTRGKPAIAAIIFDCDGVLVDSEILSSSVLMAMMAEIGLPITFEIFKSDFLGLSFAAAAARTETRFGRKLPGDFQLRYRDRLLRRMRTDLKPMPGVFEMLAALEVPFALATSSSPQRLAMSLACTGLAPHFAGRCSTASEVDHGKPAPDLPLLSARRLGVQPQRCLVIEDSEMGVQAALAAGMTVWHFAGGAHITSDDILPSMGLCARRVDSMAELHLALAETGLARKLPQHVPPNRPTQRTD